MEGIKLGNNLADPFTGIYQSFKSLARLKKLFLEGRVLVILEAPRP